LRCPLPPNAIGEIAVATGEDGAADPGQTAGMAFGQQSGPPATDRQLQELQTLLHDAGHLDFRDARGPMGFTQRQAGGKFTRQEADAFIQRLQAAADTDPEGRGVGAPSRTRPTPGPGAVSAADQRALRRLPTDALVDELRRRGWDGDRTDG
jgi:hypothetical protein